MKLPNKHLKTARMLRKHPRPSNLKSRDLDALLVALEFEIIEGKGSAVAFQREGGLLFMYHRPHPRPDVDKGAIASLDKFLEKEGIYEDIGI